MKRFTPLRRSRMVRRAPRRVARQTAEETRFIADVHLLPCVGVAAFPGHACEGRIEQSHASALGMGMKSAPMESWPFCSSLHRAWELHDGPFRGWSKLARRAFATAAVANTFLAWSALDRAGQT